MSRFVPADRCNPPVHHDGRGDGRGRYSDVRATPQLLRDIQTSEAARAAGRRAEESRPGYARKPAATKSTQHRSRPAPRSSVPTHDRRRIAPSRQPSGEQRVPPQHRKKSRGRTDARARSRTTALVPRSRPAVEHPHSDVNSMPLGPQTYNVFGVGQKALLDKQEVCEHIGLSFNYCCRNRLCGL